MVEGPDRGSPAETETRVGDAHASYMREALAQARLALGRTAPNPAVGAVVVRDGRVVGRGHTHPPGGPHAEVVALRGAGELARGATLYATLEPCAHWGRTPPCTDVILASGVREVYAAVPDPDPVAGGGMSRLRNAGVKVCVGVCEHEARRLNEGFFKRVSTGLPFVLAKYAMTLDGRIATRTGQSRWITGEEARLEAHRLRDQVDGIVVGAGTIAADDPELTTRLPDGETGAGGPHHPLRIVLDGSGGTRASARVLKPTLPGRTLMACTIDTPPGRVREWREMGAETIVLHADGTRVPVRALLEALWERDLNTVLIEGGGETLYSFLAEGLIDRVQVYIAPKLVGGRGAPGPFGGEGIDTMGEAWWLRDVAVRSFGSDLLVDGYVDYEVRG